MSSGKRVAVVSSYMFTYSSYCANLRQLSYADVPVIIYVKSLSFICNLFLLTFIDNILVNNINLLVNNNLYRYI